MSNIDLGKSDDGFVRRHFGIEYERVISKNDKWVLAIPITYGDLRTLSVTDYYRKGHDLYIAPGIKYYPKGFGAVKGFSVSAHLLVGQKQYNFESWGNQVDLNAAFIGLLANGHYAIKFS